MPPNRLLRSTLIFLLATYPFASDAASISGGDETVETTPTPRPGFIKNEDGSVAEPKETPRQEASKTGFPFSEATPEPTPVAATPAPVAENDYRTLLRDARVAFRKKDYDTALEFVRKAEALKPDVPDILNFRGAIYAETGRYAEAIKLYEKSLEIAPKSFWPSYNIAEVDFIQKKYTDARAKFQAMQVDFPDIELLRFKVILTYLLEKKESEAKTELDKFKTPSNSASYEYSMAAWEFYHKNTAKAKEWLDSGERIFGYDRTGFLYESLAAVGYVPTERPWPKKR